MVGAVEDQGVKVDVEVECPAESLNEGDRPDLFFLVCDDRLLMSLIHPASISINNCPGEHHDFDFMGAILRRMTIGNGAAERLQSADIQTNVRRSSFGTLRVLFVEFRRDPLHYVVVLRLNFSPG